MVTGRKFNSLEPRFKVRLRTKNFTVKPMRAELLPVRFRTVVRFGSTTSTKKIFPKYFETKKIIEINTVDAIENSRSKLRMKDCFLKAGVPQSNWWVCTGKKPIEFLNLSTGKEKQICTEQQLPYPILAKREFGFKGHGMHKFDTPEELVNWLSKNSLEGYYFEQFMNYSREYRLHCTKDGCFYTCRKMLKEDAEDRYYRNDSNCVWFVEENAKFDKPVNWKNIESDCVKALQEVGLTLGAFDVKIQSSEDGKGRKRENPNYIIIEVNSAPAFGDGTLQKYTEVINKIINEINGKI